MSKIVHNKSIAFLAILFFSSISINAQSWHSLTLQEFQGEYFELVDSLESDNNYLLVTTAEWCGWCKRALSEWKNCYEEFSCAYDLEIIALCSDGFIESDQRYMIDYFKNNDIPFRVWFTTHASLKNSFDFTGYPTSFLIRNDMEQFDKMVGYRSCEDLTEVITTNYAEYYTPSSDADNDGVPSCFDCNDLDPDRSPNIQEIPFNGIDDDCNARTYDNDGDQDGYTIDEDCNDEDPEIHPDHGELCNLYDDNCNGEIDEGFDTRVYFIDEDGDGYGSSLWWEEACRLPPSYSHNSKDCDDSDPNINPSAEDIPNNGIDEDCNGEDLIVSSIYQEEELTIHIYPNPVNDILQLDLPYPIKGDLNIYSSIGELQFKGPIATKIDVSLLNPGVYLLELVTREDGHRLTKTFYIE